MAEPKLRQLLQRRPARDGFAWYSPNGRFPSGVSFAIAASAVLAYWSVGVIATLFDYDFLPATAWYFLYFAHYAALGGLLGAFVPMKMANRSHAVLWGAIGGTLLAALLMT